MESGTLIADRYRLERPIGAGGMGSVWQADDTVLDRSVAVKLLHPGLDRSPNWRGRFEREARTVAGLAGECFASVHDYGETVDGDRPLLYIVMELVEGSSLSELLASGRPLPPGRTMHIVAGVADALDRAHRQGVVHRDVKPGNILIDTEDRVRLVDFGISTLTDASRMTTTGTVLGTVTYVAPEQIADQEVTGAADLYALGVVAYECLAGEPPFESQHVSAIINAHLNSEPPVLPAAVPAAVADVVTTALRKQPEERWASGAAFAQACRDAVDADATVPVGAHGRTPRTKPMPLGGTPPEPTALLPADEAKDRPERRRRMLLLLVPVLLVVSVSTTISLSPWNAFGGDEDGGEEPKVLAASESASPTRGETGEPTPTPIETATAASTPTAHTGGATESSGAQRTTEDDHVDPAPAGTTEPEPEPEAPASGDVPNVSGMTASAAEDLLVSRGFDFVTLYNQPVEWVGLQPGQCEVVAQDPAAGSTAAYDDQIRVGYYVQVGQDDDCA